MSVSCCFWYAVSVWILDSSKREPEKEVKIVYFILKSHVFYSILTAGHSYWLFRKEESWNIKRSKVEQRQLQRINTDLTLNIISLDRVVFTSADSIMIPIIINLINHRLVNFFVCTINHNSHNKLGMARDIDSPACRRRVYSRPACMCSRLKL